MRIITACCTRAFQRCTSRIDMHVLLTFQEVMLISKTRNPLGMKSPSCAARYTPIGAVIYIALFFVRLLLYI